MGGSRPQPEPEAGTSEKQDSFEGLRRLYVQACAAGISDVEYSRMTMTRLLARLDGEQLRRYWAAKPIFTAMLPHISEDSLKEIVRESEKPATKSSPSITSRALLVFLDEYLPSFMREEVKEVRSNRGVKPVAGLPVEAARGIMASYRRGDFNANLVWVSVNPHFAAISATASRGGKA